MEKVMIEFKIVGKELLLHYELLTKKCSWCIFDLGGIELCNGDLKGKPPHKIPIASLDPALYQLCVIDGDKLLNMRIKIA